MDRASQSRQEGEAGILSDRHFDQTDVCQIDTGPYRCAVRHACGQTGRLATD